MVMQICGRVRKDIQDGWGSCKRKRTGWNFICIPCNGVDAIRQSRKDILGIGRVGREENMTANYTEKEHRWRDCPGVDGEVINSIDRHGRTWWNRKVRRVFKSEVGWQFVRSLYWTLCCKWGYISGPKTYTSGNGANLRNNKIDQYHRSS